MGERTTWGGGKSKEGLSLASHWGLLCPLPNHQYLARTLASPSHSRSWGTMALHRQVPTAFHIFSYSCLGTFTEMECIIPWWCFVLFRNSSSWYQVELFYRAFLWHHSQRGSSWHLLPFIIFISGFLQPQAGSVSCLVSEYHRKARRWGLWETSNPSTYVLGVWRGLLWSSLIWSHESNTLTGLQEGRPLVAGSRRTF